MNRDELEVKLREVAGDIVPRDEHRFALRSAALHAFDTAEPVTSEATAFRISALNHRRKWIMKVTRIGIAFTIVVALGVWGLAPARPARAGLAEYAGSILQAKSMTFTIRVQIEGQPATEGKGYVLGQSTWRQEIAGVVQIHDVNTGTTVSLTPSIKQAYVMNLRNRDPKQEREDFLTKVWQILQGAQTEKEKIEALGEKEIDGRKAIGFRIAVPAMVFELWGDSNSRLPILLRCDARPTSKVMVEYTNFQFNTPIDAKLFDTKPPADYTVFETNFDARPPEEADFVKSLELAYELGGALPDELSVMGISSFVARAIVSQPAGDQKGQLQKSVEMGRGIGFALALPESKEAHYAGKGAKREQKQTPVFWYKPTPDGKYRVVFADLTVRDLDEAPKVPDAIPIPTPKAKK